MIKEINKKIYHFFNSGHERTLIAKKNIAISFFIKALSIILSLLLVPLTIKFVDPAKYGIWLTFYSIITWFSFFDVGLGNGLKNKLAEFNALGEKSNSKKYISTTYAIFSIISLGLFLCFWIGNQFINWHLALSIIKEDENLNIIALTIFGIFCINFVLQTLNTVLTAFHSIAKIAVINLIGQALCLLLILFVTTKLKGSLMLLIIILGGTPLVIQLLASLWLFKNDLQDYSPSLKSIDFSIIKNLLNIGIAFFLIQIGGLILFQTDNIIIIKLFGASNVTVFNIDYKYFSIIVMGFTIIITPFWSAFTDAYSKQDFYWIKSSFYKMYKLWGLFVVFTLILLILSPLLINLWIGKKIVIPFKLSIVMALYVIGICWLLIHCYLLNGIGKIRIQLYLYILSSIINIPLGIFLGHLFGLPGVTISNILVMIGMGIVLYFQCKKILNNKATGAWNR